MSRAAINNQKDRPLCPKQKPFQKLDEYIGINAAFFLDHKPHVALRLVGTGRDCADMAPRRKFPAGFVEPCIPTLAARPPPGADWVHEINHDGYRLIICRDGYAVCLFTRLGYDWSDRYPATTASPSSVN